MKLKSFLVENWVSCIAIIISILSIWLTISFRADQFAVVRYEKQLEAFKEILVMVNDSFRYVEPFLKLDTDHKELSNLRKQYRSILDEIVQIQEKTISTPNFSTEAERSSYLYDISSFNLDWEKVEIFKKNLNSTKLEKIEKIKTLSDFVDLLENTPNENQEIGFVVLDDKEMPDLSSNSGIFVKDKSGILESLFVNLNEFRSATEEKGQNLSRRVAFLKPKTKIWREKFSEFRNIVEIHKSTLDRYSKILENINLEDVIAFWQKFNSVIVQNALILPQDVSASISEYYSYCINLPLLMTVPMLNEMGHDLDSMENVAKIFEGSNLDFYDKNDVAAWLCNLPQAWDNMGAATNHYYEVLLKISNALGHYYPNSVLDESLKRLVFGAMD